MTRARKQKNPVEETHSAENPPVDMAQEAIDQFNQVLEDDVETQEVSAKHWAKAPNPFSSIGYYWQDYAIRYQENHERNEVQIKFGDGTLDAKPKNFEKIEPLLKANGMRWNSKDKAWYLRLEWQVKNTEEGAAQTNEQVRRNNAKARGMIENLLPEIVKLEEEVRGPATGRSQKPPEAAR
jgi:hypothetical protein